MYIITGGAGFIGSALVRSLNDQGISDILVVDNLGTSEKWQNIAEKHIVDYMHKAQFIDYIERNCLPYEHITTIIHLGACSSTTEQDAEYMMQNNYRYSKLLAQWALERDIRFIYASSAATYGDGTLGFSDEDEVSLTLRPLNVYGLSKQLFDVWALKTSAVNQMVGLKFFNVFGPNEYHKGSMSSVIFKAFYQVRDTGKIKLFKSYREDYAHGEQKRDFVYVKDCCAVMSWLAENKSVNGIFNVGTGHSRSWNDLARAVFSAMGIEPKIEYIEMPEILREKYQYYTQASMGKLINAGCPVAMRSLEEGAKDYVQGHLAGDNYYY